jgi:hypothetical protein
MAETFSYTAANSVIAPNTAPVTASVPTSTAKAFESLSSMVKGYAGAKYQQEEQARQEAEKQAWQKRRAGEALYKFQQEQLKAEQDQLKNKEKIEDDADKVKATSDKTILNNWFNGFVAEAGTDSASISEGLAAYTEAHNRVFANLSPKMQASLTKQFNDDLESAYNKANKAIQSNNKLAFKNDQGARAVNFASIAMTSPQNIKGEIENVAAVANTFGVSRKEAADEVIKGGFYALAKNINTEEAQRTGNYGDVKQLQQYVDALKAAKLRNSDEVVFDLQSKVDTLKNKIDSQVSSEITSFIEQELYPQAMQLNKEALDNKAITENKYVANYAKALNKITDSRQYKLNTMQYMANRNNGVLPFEGLTGSDKTMATNQAKQTIATQLMQGKPNAVYLQTQARTNPEFYRKTISSLFGNTLQEINVLANTPVKTEEAKQALIEQLGAKSQMLQQLQTYSFGSHSPEDATKKLLVDYHLRNGNLDALQEGLRTLSDKGDTIRMVSKQSTEYKDLVKEVDADMLDKAHRTMSALVSSGVDETTALEGVVQQYGTQQLENDTSVTGSFLQTFTASTTKESLEFLPQILTADVTYTSAALNDNPDAQMALFEIQENIASFLNNVENPRFEFNEDGVIEIRDPETKERVVTPFTRQNVPELVQELKLAYDKENKEGGYSRLAMDIGLKASKQIAKGGDFIAFSINSVLSLPEFISAASPFEELAKATQRAVSLYTERSSALLEEAMKEGNLGSTIYQDKEFLKLAIEATREAFGNLDYSPVRDMEAAAVKLKATQYQND